MGPVLRFSNSSAHIPDLESSMNFFSGGICYLGFERAMGH